MATNVIHLGVSYDDYYECLCMNCLLKQLPGHEVTDEFEHPYEHEVMFNEIEETKEITQVMVNGIVELSKVIDKEDCLPDVGLLNCKSEKFQLDLKNVTLRELFKEVIEKII